MELRDIVGVLRKYWLSILVLTLLGLVAAGYTSLTATPKYRAQTTVLVSVQLGGDSISDLNQGSSFAERQVRTYAEVARSQRVLEPVVNQLGLRTSPRALRGDVATSTQSSVTLIDITVTRSDAREAAAIADAVAAELGKAVRELSPDRVGGPAVSVDPITTAAVPSSPSSPDVPRNLALGMLLGAVLGLGWAALRKALDTKVRTEADVRALAPQPVLGTVSYDSKASGKSPTIVAPPLSIRSEEYRRIRTNLQFVDAARRPRTIVVTSSRGGEGKSVTSINLALAIAESGTSVCLVDADLRRPSVAGYLGLPGAAGLTTVLIGRASIDDVLQPVGSAGLQIIAAGRIPPNPSELLGSEAMAAVTADLVARFDIVLFDCAPLLPVTDAAVLASTTDGVLLVAGGTIVTRTQLGDAVAMLDTADASLLGIVLNRAARKDGGVARYGYHPHVVELSHGDVAQVEVKPEKPRESGSGRAKARKPAASGAEGSAAPVAAPKSKRSRKGVRRVAGSSRPVVGPAEAAASRGGHAESSLFDD